MTITMTQLRGIVIDNNAVVERIAEALNISANRVVDFGENYALSPRPM